MTQPMNISQIREQLDIRMTWEEQCGGVSKTIQQISDHFNRRVKVEGDLEYRMRAIAEIIKRMNAEGTPKDAMKVMAALDCCDKLSEEVVGNQLDGLDVASDEIVSRLADIAWEEGIKHGLEIYIY